MLTIVWSSRALNDLDDIAAYIGARDREASLRLLERIEGSVLPVAQFPYLHRAGRKRGTREIVAHRNYVVVYRLTRKHVVVLAVVHAALKYP